MKKIIPRLITSSIIENKIELSVYLLFKFCYVVKENEKLFLENLENLKRVLNEEKIKNRIQELIVKIFF